MRPACMPVAWNNASLEAETAVVHAAAAEVLAAARPEPKEHRKQIHSLKKTVPRQC